ncbi:NACHT N-terminal Helical domain 1-containing protein [Actinomyces howellii]|uniref:NACHT N-terminal Helical domain 1-containing protein n=1 Tax=Actinomyces howellii TaxID=52771 RepID=UPI000F831811|nr:hypothetical protein [Actinomyces howellii]
MKSSPFLDVGLSLTSLLLNAAQLAVTPSPVAVAGTLDASQRLWGDICRLSGKDKGTRAFAQRVAERLDDRLRTVSSDADEQEIRGAATAVGALLREVSTDDAAVVEAVRHPEGLGSLLRRRAAPHRELVAASAEPFFDALLPAVAEEFARLAPGSPRFQEGALLQLLDGLDRIEEGLGDLQHGQDEIRAGIVGIHDRLNDFASIWPAAAPERIRFGSRPARAPHFITRGEQEAARRFVIDAAEPLTALTGMRGRGKSQLATTVAAHCEEAGWPLVAWMTASSREALVSALAELGQCLGVSTEDAHSPEVLAGRCLDRLRSTEVSDRLIVLDNIESFDDLRDLVPTGPGLRVLATTTRTQVPGHWQQVPVDVFNREQ